jgi:phosphonate transport system substrate-binding protein
VKVRLAASALGLSLAGLPVAASPPPPPQGLGVVSVYNPRLLFLKYQPLVDYLSASTGSPWDLVIVPTYDRIVTDLCSGKVTAALLGPFAYVRAHAACEALPVAKLATGGKKDYRGLILVRDDSSLRHLRDLAGKSFGFGPPVATASYMEMLALLESAGLEPGKNVSCRHFAHHEEAARAVLLGEVDACGVRDIVGEKYARRGLRILARTEPIPNFVLALRPATGAAIREALLEALVRRPRENPSIRETMRGWDEELAGGFLPAADAEYDAVRRLAERLFGPSALTAPEASLECRPRGR